MTGGGDEVQAEAGSSVGHFVALAWGLGPASSLLACGIVKSETGLSPVGSGKKRAGPREHALPYCLVR